MFVPSDSFEIQKKFKMSENLSVREFYKQKQDLYKKIFRWACANWKTLIINASYSPTNKNCVSTADQIRLEFNIPYHIADDIANSISISMAIK